jgi:hypothetical protein
VIYSDGAIGISGWSNKEPLRLFRPRVPVLEPRGRGYRIARDRRDELERGEPPSNSELGPGNHILGPGQIRGVKLRRGLVYSRLLIEVNDGRRIKVLWMRRYKLHPSTADIEDALFRSLGPKFEVT